MHVRVPRRPAGDRQRAAGRSRRRPATGPRWHWRSRRADGAVPRVLRRRSTSGSSAGAPRAARRTSSRCRDGSPRRQQRRAMALMRRTPRVLALAGGRGSAPTRSTRTGGADHVPRDPASRWRTRPARPTPTSAGRARTGSSPTSWRTSGSATRCRCESWRDIWLNEGLATFFEMRWTHYDGCGSASGLAGSRPGSTYPAAATSGTCRSATRARTGSSTRRSTSAARWRSQALRHRIGQADFDALLRPLGDRAAGHGNGVDRRLRGARRGRSAGRT